VPREAPRTARGRSWPPEQLRKRGDSILEPYGLRYPVGRVEPRDVFAALEPLDRVDRDASEISELLLSQPLDEPDAAKVARECRCRVTCCRGEIGHNFIVKPQAGSIERIPSLSFDPCQASVGVIDGDAGRETFRFGYTGAAVLLLPTWPGEQQRSSTLTAADLASLAGDESAAWAALEAVRRLDRQLFDEWALAERQRHARGVASWCEQEGLQVGAEPAAGSYPASLEPSRAAMVACDPHASPSQTQEAFKTVLSRDMGTDRALAGQYVRAALQQCESRPERQRVLEGGALAAYWHLAARLGQEDLDNWSVAGHGRDRRLRVCQLTGRVFRARNARYHPSLPREPVQAKPGRHHVAAYVGPLWRPTDPFAPSARAVRLYGTCQACGELFTAATSKREYCSNACRKAHSRATIARESNPY
jgi:hypothetical protein